MPNNMGSSGDGGEREVPPTTSANGPVSDQTLDRLRVSAAMAVAFPDMAVKVRVGETTCLEVAWTPTPGVSHRLLPPCAFHRAVASAVRMRRTGERIAMRGVPAGAEPAIDWGVAPGARILPGGIIRMDDDAWLHAAPVLGAEPAIAHALSSTPGLVGRRDEALGVTIVHGKTPQRDKVASRSMVDALLDVIARAGVADLEHRLSGRLPATAERRAWR